jgi:excisionase family DNA binding protein
VRDVRPIHRSIAIEQLIDRYPSAAGFMVEKGLLCFVCGEPVWEPSSPIKSDFLVRHPASSLFFLTNRTSCIILQLLAVATYSIKCIMHDLLTTKQTLELLKVDRTTIYRMLGDGRLTAVKVGKQWRFPRQQIDDLLSGNPHTSDPTTESSSNSLPVPCIQLVQDVFADIGQIGALTTLPDGTLLTTMSNPCRFCSLILGSESGRQACISSWRKLAAQSERRPLFVECHAGLHYARARIDIDGELKAMVIAGQCHASPPDPSEESTRITSLAERHGLDPAEMTAAARDIPIIDVVRMRQIAGWLEKLANTFEHFTRERLELVTRLRRIADMSAFK